MPKYHFKASIVEFEQLLYTHNWKTETNKGTISIVAVGPNNMEINWWESTGTIYLAKNKNAADEQLLKEIIKHKLTKKDPKKIFIVHGHDESAKRDLENILYKWNLKPVALVDEIAGGNTIIENLEKHTDHCSFGIVLLTPDDVGYAKRVGLHSLKQRARQNVIMELGVLIGKFGRQNVAILVHKEIEQPSDISGLLYLPYKTSILEVQDKLRKELLAAKINLQEQV